jgi:phage-related protein
MQTNKIGVPLVSITASFAQLERAAEYQDAHLPDRISLFETVKVEIPDWGLFVSAKVVKLEHNTLEEKIENVEIGSYVQNVADSIAAQKQELKSISAKISRYRK